MSRNAANRGRARCPRCWVRREHCLCGDLRCFDTQTELIVVRHDDEIRKATATARIAALALPRLTLVGYGDQPHLVDAMLPPLVAGEGTYLVYPAEPRSEWPATPPRRLVFLDATWRRTRRMVRRLTSLAPLPRLWLPAKAEPVLRLRQSALPEGRSTLEAIADALRLVGETAAADGLAALHELHAVRVLQARGVWPRPGDAWAVARDNSRPAT